MTEAGHADSEERWGDAAAWYRPPAVARAEADLSRSSGLARAELRCTLGGENVEIRPRPQSLLPERAESWIAVSNAANDIRLLMPERVFFRYLERLLPGEDIGGVAQDVTLAVFEQSIEPFLVELERATSRSAQLAFIAAADGAEPRPGHCWHCAIAYGEASGPVPLMLELPESDALPVAALLDRFFPRQERLDHLPLRASLRFGCTLVTLDDLEGLQPGDALLLDLHLLHERKAVLVVEEHLVTPCVIDGELRLATAPMLPAHQTRFSGWCGPVGQHHEPDVLGSPAAVTLRLDFDGWSGFVDPAMLGMLAVGEQIRSVGDLNTRVSVRLNGHVVGTGEIVQVSDRFAARIDQLRLAR